MGDVHLNIEFDGDGVKKTGLCLNSDAKYNDDDDDDDINTPPLKKQQQQSIAALDFPHKMLCWVNAPL